MSRDRGKIPSQKGRKRGQAQPKTERDPWGDHGKFNSGGGVDKYVKRTGHVYDIIPRVRSSGVVGPETDYSIRSSYVPVGFYLNLQAYWPELLGAIRNPMFGFHERLKTVATPRTRPPKGYMSITPDSERGYLVWTKFAHTYGIEYSGKRMYKFPRSFSGHYHSKFDNYEITEFNPFTSIGRKEEFELLKTCGKISHRRSEASKIRRAARKAVRVHCDTVDLKSLVFMGKMSRKEAYRESVPVKNRPAQVYIRGKRRNFKITAQNIGVFNVLAQIEPVKIPKIKFLGETEEVTPIPVFKQTVYKEPSVPVYRKNSMWRIKPRSLHYGRSTIGSIADDDEENLHKLRRRGVLYNGTPYGVYNSSSSDDEDTSVNWWE